MWNNKLFGFNIKVYNNMEALLLFIVCNFRCFYIFPKFTKSYHKDNCFKKIFFFLEDFFQL